MRKKTAYVFNIILMIVVLIFTFYTLLHGEDLRSILKVLRGADKSWLIFAALFAVAYLVLQAVSLKIIVQSAGTPMRLMIQDDDMLEFEIVSSDIESCKVP